MIRNVKLRRAVAVSLTLLMFNQIITPTVALALTAGPTAPEFSSFTPVATTDMVSLFTGDFNYNLPVIEIPGPEGGGYSLSLSYNSGSSCEQEASWVGFGFNINPGSINRNLRGFPDDYDGEPVDYYNKTRPNWTSTMTLMAGLEAFSLDVSLSGNQSLQFNNHQGFQRTRGLGIGVKGIASLNVNFDPNGVTFSPNINPIGLINKLTTKSKKKADNNTQTNEDTKEPQKEQETKNKRTPFSIKGSVKSGFSLNAAAMAGTWFGLYTFSEAVRATSFTPYKGFSYNRSVSLQINTVIPVGVELGASGAFNMQFNEYKSQKLAYGYQYTPSQVNDQTMMDYYVEKGSTYDKRDFFIGMPFANPDVFGVSGEGLNGGFRLFNSGVGHFKPNTGKSKLEIGQIGYEVMIGANLGVGLDFGFGSQTTEMTPWELYDGKEGAFNASSPVFRFNNDMGGALTYTDNNDAESARVRLTNPVFGFRRAKADPPGEYSLQNDDKKAASFIQQKTLAQLVLADVPAGINTAKTIGGFEIFNESGVRYEYNRPVFVRNETNLNVDVRSGDEKLDRHLAFRNLNLGKSLGNAYRVSDEVMQGREHDLVIGEIKTKPYVSTYLLTAITTPQYVDIAPAGPGLEDFGGWTKFTYRKKYGEGAGQAWYRYRTPYNGLIYEQNSISDTRDDVGSVITGEKEVYLLDYIDTKTHRAYFVTNKTVSSHPYLQGSQANTDLQRLDGKGAVDLTFEEDPAARKQVDGKPAQGVTPLEYLEKIVLFAKDRDGSIPNDKKPLKTVRFQYDYSLVPNVPNNTNSTYGYLTDNPNLSENSGKLTLRKVWFEYEGTVPARVSPYEFSYLYRHPSELRAGKSYFELYAGLGENVQNPVYGPHLLDPWGSIMQHGRERKGKGIPWIDQSASPGNDFDPAAWQLKSIRLPSGGEIHVQYEQKDYSYVQDRKAMAMASLADVITDGYGSTSAYLINPQDLGVQPQDQDDVNALAALINDYFKVDPSTREAEDKVYFKFLYALKGNNPSLDDCRSEYISGYANFKGADVEERNGNFYIKVTLGSSNSGGGERAPVPRQACYEFVVNQRQGKLDNSECTEPDYETEFDNAMVDAANHGQQGLSGSTKRSLASSVLSEMAKDSRVITYNNVKKSEVCMTMSTQQSFVRLPMLHGKRGGGVRVKRLLLLHGKRGGGVRVKRLLLYDDGIESSDAAIYGTTYRYVQEDGKTSSGVATNEPSEAREENPLVNFLAKGDQGFFSRITVGEDKEQTEGPLGESLLPAPSVGYSRVVVENIHTGNTGTGFVVHEFHTARDYPFDRYYGQAGEENAFDVNGNATVSTSLEDQKRTDYLIIPAGLFNYSTSKVWLAQGFRFIINEMHGQNKKITTYGGTYGGEETDIENGYVVSFQQYDYYEPGEKVKMFAWNDVNNNFDVTYAMPGKEMEVAMERKRLVDETIDFSIEIDISVTISIFPPIFVTVMPSFSHADKSIATHATTKVIRYPVIQKSITSFQDGVYNKQEYVAFHQATGKPLLTRSTDGFHDLALLNNNPAHDGSYYTFTIPAEWMYAGMGQKSGRSSPSEYTNQLGETTATFTVYGKEPDPNWFLQPDRIVNADVQTFSKNWSSSWSDPRVSEDYGVTGTQVTALNSVWRPKSSFVYKADAVTSSSAKRIYESGYFSMNGMFNWSNESSQPDAQWIKMNEVTRYSPHGNAIEEKNVLNIPSAALHSDSYHCQVPTMVARNAAYHSIFFRDYEHESNTPVTAHSGKGAMTLSNGSVLATGLFVTRQLQVKGGVFSAWIMGLDEQLSASAQLLINGANPVPLHKIAKTGSWCLYQSEVPGDKFPAEGAALQLSVAIDGAGAAQLYADDVRFQPYDAQATCYVYDYRTLRLITSFDDQHFGLYYQYNDEGKLVRKLVETERGLKTLQETQYHIPKTGR
jgi:hypothetical protein